MNNVKVLKLIKEILFFVMVLGLIFGGGYFVGEKYSNKRVWLKGNIFLISPKADGESFLTIPVKYDKKTGIIALDVQQRVTE